MKFYEFFKQKEWKKWDKSQWAILILAGVLLMVVAIPADSPKRKAGEEKTDGSILLPKEEQPEVSENYVGELESKLEAVLSRINGAGRVKVMVTLMDTGESIVEKDTVNETTDLQETDETGASHAERGTQTTRQSVYNESDSGKTPFVGKEMAPKIAGVLIVAEGGDDTAVKQNISEAVMALFQIDVNRIKVVKMNIQEEVD